MLDVRVEGLEGLRKGFLVAYFLLGKTCKPFTNTFGG